MPNDFPVSPVQRPGYGWQPQGALAGMLYARDRARYEDRGRLEDVVAGAQAEDVQARLPIERRGLEATTRKQELGTQLEEVLQPGKEHLGLGEQRLAGGQQGIAGAIQAIAGAPPGPDYIPRISDAIKASGADPNHPLIQHVLSSGSPEEASQRARAVLQHQSVVAPEYRQAMDLGTLKGEYDLEGRRISGEYGLRAASRANQGKTKTLREEWNAENDPIKKATLAAQILEMRDAPEDMKREAAATVRQLVDLIQLQAQRGAPPQLPGFPQPAPIRVPAPGGPQAPQQAQPGKPTMRWNPQTRKLEPIS